MKGDERKKEREKELRVGASVRTEKVSVLKRERERERESDKNACIEILNWRKSCLCDQQKVGSFVNADITCLRVLKWPSFLSTLSGLNLRSWKRPTCVQGQEREWEYYNLRQSLSWGLFNIRVRLLLPERHLNVCCAKCTYESAAFKFNHETREVGSKQCDQIGRFSAPSLLKKVSVPKRMVSFSAVL